MNLLGDQSHIFAAEDFQRGALYGFGVEDQGLRVHHRCKNRNKQSIAPRVVENSDIAAARSLDFANIRNEVLGHTIGFQHFQAIGLEESSAHHVPPGFFCVQE